MFRITLFFLFLTSFLSAQLIKNQINLEGTFSSSSVVVDGQVIEKQSYWDAEHKMIYTVHKVKVFKSFKGEQNPYLYLLTEGGAVGLQGLIVKPNIRLDKNTTGYFMLNAARKLDLDGFENENKLLELKNNFNGFFYYDSYTDKVSVNRAIKTTKGDFEEIIKTFSGEMPTTLNVPTDFDFFSQRSSVNDDIQISTISPTSIVAGNNEILTVTGSGFGSFESGVSFGYVSFRDSDSGGQGWINCLRTQVVSWTDNQIRVEVPSDSGSGSIRITTSDNRVLQSDTTIDIPYSINSYRYEIDGIESEFPIYHAGSMYSDVTDPNSTVQDNVSGGSYKMIMNSDFYDNEEARDAFETALLDWVCSSGQNFELVDGVTEISSQSSDYTNVVTFATTNALGVTYSWYDGCIINNSELQLTWREIDIIFNNNANWGYGDNVSGNQYDFNSTASHEIGHALGFGHNINSQSLMHYASSVGPSDEIIDPYLPGSQVILGRDTSLSICGNLDTHSISACSSIDPTLDSDNDGVSDIFDICANSPSGEVVNNRGCAPSQLDTDEDGVSDDVDQCENTPLGSVVDQTGCADTDNDGVTDNIDSCPETLPDYEIDQNGCALYQKDSDNDGVTDNFDQCPDTNLNSSVDVNGCDVFYLSQDSISVSVNSNTCIGSNDGSIIIKANNTNYDYSINIENDVYSLSYFDGYEKTHRNLGVGTYRVCINVVGYENFEQCYDVAVSSPDPLSVLDLFNSQTGNLSLSLGGSDEYQIVHNGLTNYINNSSYSLQLEKGLNIVKVNTDLDCQGAFEMNYFYSNEVQVYPNPVNNNLKFVIGGMDDSVEIIIYDLRGKIVMKKYASTSHLNRSSLDVSNLEAGIYFIEISSETINKNLKIIKDEK
jgi:hypothetical protein